MFRKKCIFKIDNSFTFKKKLLFWLKKKSDFCVLNSNSYTKNKYTKYDWIAAFDIAKNFAANENCFKKIVELENEKDWAFGHISYDLKNEIEKLYSKNSETVAFPLVYFFVPKYMIFIKNRKVEFIFPDNENDKLIKKIFKEIYNLKYQKINLNYKNEVKNRVTFEEYKKIISELKEHIQQGNIYEINYCMEFYANNSNIDPFILCQKLWQESFMPFSVFYRINKNKFLIAASPERFLCKKDNKIIAQPIKGTIKKSKNIFLNYKNLQNFKKNIKEKAENVMIVDLMRNDLTKVSQKNTIKVEELCQVYPFKNIYQMISTVSGILKEKIGLAEILKAIFPMGSMTGAPKIKAMELIEKYEKTKRGLFSGSVGYIDPNGDFDFNVIIRSILFDHQKNYLSFSAGSAITAKSNIENEYNECLLKVKNIFKIITS